MEGDVEENTFTIDYEFRRLQTIPCSLHKLLQSKSILPLIDYAVVQMRGLRYWGSRFMAFHLARLLEEGRELPCLTKTTILSMVKCVADGSGSLKDADVTESIRIWKLALSDTQDLHIPSIRGLNTISTKTVEEFFVAFQNYHLFGLQNHWTRLISRRYGVSKKSSMTIVRLFMEKVQLACLDTFPSIESLSKATQRQLIILFEMEEAVLGDIAKLKTLAGRIRWHSSLASRLANPHLPDMEPIHIGLSPLCSASLPFITICKKSMDDLLQFSRSKNSDHVLGVGEKHKIYLDFLEVIVDNKSVLFGKGDTHSIGTYFKLPHRKRWTMSPTFRTDGYALHLIWQTPITTRKSVKQREWSIHQKKIARKLQTWQDELDLAAKEKRHPDQRKKLGLTKERPIHVPFTDIWRSSNAEAFTQGRPGTFPNGVAFGVRQCSRGSAPRNDSR